MTLPEQSLLDVAWRDTMEQMTKLKEVCHETDTDFEAMVANMAQALEYLK